MTKHSKKIAHAALASLVSLSMLSATTPAAAASNPPDVKCYGIAAGGKNDCGTVVSACASSIAKPGACYAWIFVPKGICEKISGASPNKPAADCKAPDGKPVTN